MQIDDSLADGEPEAEAAILAGDTAPALLKRVENFRNQFLFDTNASIGDLDNDLLRCRVAGRDLNPSTFGGELRRILDHVPKHLLKPRRVGPGMMFAGVEVANDLDLFADQIAGAN